MSNNRTVYLSALRRKPFVGFLRVGGPSRLSLPPQKTEPLVSYASNAAPDRPAGRPGDSP
jgi:hypothetical protein